MGSLLDSISGWTDSGFWAAMLVDASLKGALILIAAAALARFFRPASASFRHLVRSLALLALVLLPLCRLLVPTWQVEILPRSPWPDPASWAAALPAASTAAAPVGGQVAFAPNPGASIAEASQPPVRAAEAAPSAAVSERRSAVLYSLFRRWETLLGLVWALGAVFFLARLLLGVFCVQVAIWRSRPLTQDGWEGLALQVRRRLNLRRRVRLCTAPGLEVALSVGVLRSLVLLPEVAVTWSASRRRSILLHEFSHVKRWDNLTNLVSQVACALHWFNPLAWTTARALTVDREQACDDEVLAAGTKASDYAGHLLEIARAVTSRRLWGRMEVSQSSALKDRLHAVLNPRANRSRPSFAGCVLGVVLVSAGLVPLSALQPWVDSTAELGAGSRDFRGWQASDAALRRSNAGSPFLPAGLNADSGDDPGAEAADKHREAFQSLLELTRPASLTERARTATATATAISEPANLPRTWNTVASAFRRWTAPEPVYPRPETASVYRTALFRVPASSPGGNPPAPPGPPEPPVFEAEVVRRDLGTLGGAESKALDINDLGFVVGESRKDGNLVHPFLWTARTGMTDLGNPLGVHTRAVKVNRTGQVLCETFNSNQFRGLLWSPTEGLLDIGTLDPEAPFTQPRAMNESGMIAGASRDETGRLRAFVWTPEGGMLDLGVPGDSVAWAINDRGQVAGYTEQTFTLGVETRAFFWDPDTGLRFLRPDGAPLSIATALNNRGQVVGYAEFADGYPRAFLWSPEAGMVDLGVADPLYPITLATGINDLGQVVGQSVDTADPSEPRQLRAFRWTPETGMSDIGASSGESQLAINAAGQIVGAYVRDFDGVDPPTAFLWTESGSVGLNDAESTVVAINNRSQAVGSSLAAGEERHAFLWEIKIRRSGDPGQD